MHNEAYEAKVEMLETTFGDIEERPSLEISPRPVRPLPGRPSLLFTPTPIRPDTVADADAVIITIPLLRHYDWPDDVFKIVNSSAYVPGNQEPTPGNIMRVRVHPAGFSIVESGLCLLLEDPAFIEYCTARNIRRFACDGTHLAVRPDSDQRLLRWSTKNSGMRVVIHLEL